MVTCVNFYMWFVLQQAQCELRQKCEEEKQEMSRTHDQMVSYQFIVS